MAGTAGGFCLMSIAMNQAGSILIKIKKYLASLPTIILAGGFLYTRDLCMASTTLRLSQFTTFCATLLAAHILSIYSVKASKIEKEIY